MTQTRLTERSGSVSCSPKYCR